MAKAARAPNPAIAPVLDEGESKFFESRGAEDIPAPSGGDAVAPAPSPAPSQAAPVAPAAEPEEEEVHVDEAGNQIKPPKGFVPNIALRKERDQRREAEKKAAEKEREFTVLNSRLETLMQLANAPQPAQPVQIPDAQTDPVGHFNARLAQLEQENSQLRQGYQQQQQTVTLQTNVQRLTQIATVQEAEFAKATPDYNEAAEFVKGVRDAQLAALGMTDPVQRQAALQNEALNIAASALQQGRNPALVVYEVAKASGWKPKAAAAATPPANGKVTPAQQVQMAAAGQIAGQSLGQVAGTATAPTTLESLLKLTDKEFAEATKGDKWRQLFR